MNSEQTFSSDIGMLIEGYEDFKSQHEQHKDIYADLVEFGQNPKVLFIACCDSRVAPAVVTGSRPGDLFMVRNIANMVPPFKSDPRHHGTSAALEYGVKNLKVSNIIIFGHSHCGGIRHLMETNTDECSTDFIGSWMDVAKPAKEHVLKHHSDCSLDEQAHLCEKQSLLVSLDNLMTFPWIKEAVDKQQLTLHAWHFDLISGGIEKYQAESGTFVGL